jgi:hypothetical protein
MECPACRKVFVYRGCMCGDRFNCPYCRKKRERRLRETYIKVLKRFEYPAFLTLTLRRKGKLREDVKRLKKAFQKFRRRRDWKKRIRGYFGVIEITKNNVHIHMIIDCVWWEQGEISDIWREITGDYIVDIRRIRDKEKAIKEVFKYVLKDYSLNEEELKEVKEELKGMRLVMASKGLALSSLDTTEISGHQKCPFCGEDLAILRVFKDKDDLIDYLSDFKWDDFYEFDGEKWVKTPIMTYAWRLVNGWI